MLIVWGGIWYWFLPVKLKISGHVVSRCIANASAVHCMRPHDSIPLWAFDVNMALKFLEQFLPAAILLGLRAHNISSVAIFSQHSRPGRIPSHWDRPILRFFLHSAARSVACRQTANRHIMKEYFRKVCSNNEVITNCILYLPGDNTLLYTGNGTTPSLGPLTQ